MKHDCNFHSTNDNVKSSSWSHFKHPLVLSYIGVVYGALPILWRCAAMQDAITKFSTPHIPFDRDRIVLLNKWESREWKRMDIQFHGPSTRTKEDEVQFIQLDGILE